MEELSFCKHHSTCILSICPISVDFSRAMSDQQLSEAFPFWIARCPASCLDEHSASQRTPSRPAPDVPSLLLPTDLLQETRTSNSFSVQAITSTSFVISYSAWFDTSIPHHFYYHLAEPEQAGFTRLTQGNGFRAIPTSSCP